MAAKPPADATPMKVAPAKARVRAAAYDSPMAASYHGRRRKASVAEVLAEEIRRRTGEETIVSDLTYDLRSGDPDFVEKLVAFTFGTMALDAPQDGQCGVMPALVNGRYDLVPIPDPKLGPRKVDLATMYNVDRLRPSYENKRHLPVFLNRI